MSIAASTWRSSGVIRAASASACLRFAARSVRVALCRSMIGSSLFQSASIWRSISATDGSAWAAVALPVRTTATPASAASAVVKRDQRGRGTIDGGPADADRSDDGRGAWSATGVPYSFFLTAYRVS